MDLLNLSRTCKSLRELLMDKSSMFVWKTARRQVIGLPDCPADLTEPEYANLVFCARCHVRKDSFVSLKGSEMWNRVAESQRERCSGLCVAGTVRAANVNGMVPWTSWHKP